MTVRTIPTTLPVLGLFVVTAAWGDRIFSTPGMPVALRALLPLGLPGLLFLSAGAGYLAKGLLQTQMERREAAVSPSSAVHALRAGAAMCGAGAAMCALFGWALFRY